MTINRRFAAAATATALALTGAGALAITAGSAASASSHPPAAAVSYTRAHASRTMPPGGPVPPGFRPASVTFVSASDGWVLGTTKTCAHAPCTSVVRTTDGGRTWVGIPAPKYKLARFNLAAGLIRLRFADTSDGFAFGSQLWVTHSGGAAWHRVRQVPGYITDLETAAGVVYAVSADLKSFKLTVYASPAGSDSWHKVAGLPVSAGDGGLGTITLHGTAGWMVLGGRLYATSDGSSWVKEAFKCPAMLAIASVGAFNATHIAVQCAGNAALGSTEKLVYKSSDGGAHLSRAGRAPRGGDGGLIAEPTLRHLFIATASAATWVYASNDGGRHWHNALFLGDGGLGWYDFGFTTASQGVAVEGTPSLGSHLWLTRNAGRIWKIVTF